VTSRALRHLRDRPELFTGYTPVTASGAAAGHLLAFNRGGGSAGALTLATRLPRGLEQKGGWQDTAIRLDTAMTDELTGRAFGPGEVQVAQIL
jgi:(1->4)-alpha-D-glucan 1-alpha-D-glucosylmutase